MKILVTGVTGRIGANIAKHFLQQGHEVSGFVWPGDRQSHKLTKIGAKIIEGDLASHADVITAAKGQEIILHLGAAFQAGGPFTPEQYFDTNIKGTFNVLEAAVSQRETLKHLIVSSTDATMFKYPENGIEESIRIDTLPLDTTDWYGYSKVITEHLVDRYVRHARIPATVFRYAFVWGAGEVLTFPQFQLKTFIDQFENRTETDAAETLTAMRSEYCGEPHLIIACDRNGRPWKKHGLEVREIVHAYDRASNNPNTFGNVYQLGSPLPFTWDAIVPSIAAKIGAPYSRFNLPITPTYYEHDISPACKDFQYDPKITFESMIDDAIRFTRYGESAIIPNTL